MKISNNYSFNICLSVETVHFSFLHFQATLEVSIQSLTFFSTDLFPCVSQSAGLCPSTQQIHDGWRSLWGDRGERFWLARWKFVNSRVPLFLVLQKRGQSTCPDCTGAPRPEPRSHVDRRAFSFVSELTFASHVCVCRVWTLIRWIHCCSTTGLAISAATITDQRIRVGLLRRFVETLSFSHLSCLWRHAVSSQALPASPEIRSRTSALALRAQILGYCS